MSINKLSIVVARTPLGLIGKNNSLIWNLPKDLKSFREITLSKPVIMGRKTYESIGKPLKGRKNIVVSKNKNLKIDECVFIANSLEEAILMAYSDYSGEVMLIGGSQLYKEAINKKYVNKIYETLVYANLEGDSYFEYDESNFKLISSIYEYSNYENKYDMEFRILIENA